MTPFAKILISDQRVEYYPEASHQTAINVNQLD